MNPNACKSFRSFAFVRGYYPLLIVALGADWKSPFPNRSDGTVHKLLTDSPWSRPRSVHFTWVKKNQQPITYKDVPGNQPGRLPVQTGSPVGGIGKPASKMVDTADLIFRWATALPVRQAKALFRQRDGRLDPAKVSYLIEPRGDGYALEIFGLPSIVAHRSAGSIEAILRQSAYIRARSGKTIRPQRVEVTVGALMLDVKIHFPRTEPITVADQEIECFGDMQIFEFRERFKLSSMAYGGSLEM